MSTEWPSGRYERVLLDWRLTAKRSGLTEHEIAILAAQLAGLSVVRVQITGEGKAELLDVCYRAMCTAAFGADAMAAGVGIRRPVKRTEAA